MEEQPVPCFEFINFIKRPERPDGMLTFQLFVIKKSHYLGLMYYHNTYDLYHVFNLN